MKNILLVLLVSCALFACSNGSKGSGGSGGGSGGGGGGSGGGGGETPAEVGFVNVTDYPSYNARFVATDGGVLYAVADNLQVLKYDKMAKSWSPVKITNNAVSDFSLQGFSVSALKEKLYVIGGLENGVYSNKVWEFNPANGEWRNATPSGYKYHSEFHTSTTVGDKIYIIGGIGFIDSGSSDVTNFIGSINPVDGSSFTLPSTDFPARTNHSAAAIGSKIYVFGGGNAANASLNGLYVFDTMANSWRSIFKDGNTNSNIEEREDAVMAAVGDKLYVFGGKNSNFDVYDSFKQLSTLNETLGWDNVINSNPISAKAYESTGVVSAGKIYIFGGIGDTREYKNNFWSYDLKLSNFDNLTRKDILAPLEGSSSVSVGSDVYFLGGKFIQGYSNAFTKFSLLSRKATDATPSGLRFPPKLETSLTSSGKLFYAFGVIDENPNTVHGEFWEYNTATGELENLPPLSSTPSTPPSARLAAATVVVGNKHYVIGGKASNKILSDTWAYDFTRESWENITNTAFEDDMIPLVYHSATAIGTKIYIIGGLRDDNHPSRQVFVMETTDLSVGGKPVWRNVSEGDMPNPRFSHAATAIGETIYIFSGQDGGGNGAYLNDLLKYDVHRNSWTKISEPNMPYSHDSGYHMYNVDGTLWFLNNYKFDLRRYRP